jgi:predicted nucleic acid-binding protein
MGAVVLDSSVLFGLLDSTDAHHSSALAAIAAAAAAGNDLVVPTSVLAEVLVGAARQGSAIRDELERRLIASVDRLYPLDRDVAVHAADVRAASPVIRLPDVVVIASGRVLDAQVLTADKKWAAVDSRVTVIG